MPHSQLHNNTTHKWMAEYAWNAQSNFIKGHELFVNINSCYSNLIK